MAMCTQKQIHISSFQPAGSLQATLPLAEQTSCQYDSDLWPSVVHTTMTLNLAERDQQEPLGGTVMAKVIVGNSGKSRELELLRSDTVGRLLEKLRAELPDLGPDVSLALRGKPVRPEQCLGQLGNCSKLQFITFHRCQGG